MKKKSVFQVDKQIWLIFPEIAPSDENSNGMEGVVFQVVYLLC